MQLKFLDYAPVLHISAKTGERTPKLLETIERVAAARQEARGDGRAEPIHRRRSPPCTRRRARAGAKCAILYAAQTAVAPPTFVFFTNVATTFHFSYERFLENRLREAFGFEGTPIRMQVRRREKK